MGADPSSPLGVDTLAPPLGPAPPCPGEVGGPPSLLPAPGERACSLPDAPVPHPLPPSFVHGPQQPSSCRCPFPQPPVPAALSMSWAHVPLRSAARMEAPVHLSVRPWSPWVPHLSLQDACGRGRGWAVRTPPASVRTEPQGTLVQPVSLWLYLLHDSGVAEREGPGPLERKAKAWPPHHKQVISTQHHFF